MTTAILDQQLALRVQIEAFMAEYVHCLDADRLESWPDFFTEDASYRVCTRENYDQGLPLSVMSCQGRGMFRDRITALRTANVFEPHVYCHLIGAFRVLDWNGQHAKAESTLAVIRTMVDGAMSIFACGRSIDNFVISGREIKIADRMVILDSRQIDTLLVVPL
jgi:anthranilate 1,2-dioxygenase small subunit